ncbi:unnamed protein product [Urochloa decumbens]|uniref:KIB1-4 beta-propeller domain-containing protein n=1 Tax=Urochloa decumbens TaxID=240449 RepID=A0ABC9AI17_9POAL
MDSGRSTSADQNRRAPLPARFRNSAKPSRSRPAVAQTRRSTKCATASDTPRSDETQHRPWAGVPVDILGIVICLLPLVEDRARLRSVCRAHRSGPPPPAAAAPSPACDARLLVRQLLRRRDLDRRAPPHPAAGEGNEGGRHLPLRALVRGVARGREQCVTSFGKVILSSSPGSGSKCVAVAISRVKSAAKLALWRSGMKTWCLCDGACITDFMDIVFCHGKLYVLSSSEFTMDLFAFEISEDNNGMIVSRVERFVFELPEVNDNFSGTCRIVEWRGKLLIVAAYSGDTEFGHMIVEVRVLEADFGTNPVRFTEIVSLDGDCIFISPCSSKSFRSCGYDGVGEDLIYFIDLCPEKFVYNMKDGMMAPIIADGSEDKFWAPYDRPKTATWLFPTE